MASRSVWSGFIRFGLVSVPVKAFTATSGASAGISFNQLHKECKSRIQYKKTCPIHGEVRADEIVSGYEFSKGEYVIIDADEIQKMRTPSEKAIDVKAFIAPDAVDSRYYTGKTWYLLPDGPVALKAYALLYKTMQEQKIIAFAQVALAGREQLVVLRPLLSVLVGSYLSYAADIKPVDEFSDQSPQIDVSPAELKLAKTLTDAMKIKKFDLSEYKDDYTERVTQLIQAKVEGQEIVTPEVGEAPQVINLMDALKKSLERSGKQTATSSRPPKLSAPSVGAEGRRKRKTS